MSITRHIPNFFTSLNLLLGTIAIVYSFKGLQLFAVYLILAASILDFVDGFAARVLNAYSKMGKELDSLADLVSFGLAPSILLYYRYDQFIGHQISGGYDTIYMELLQFVPLLITVASALRLAKFNTDESQSETFSGMPTPANAILIGMFLHFTTFDHRFDPLIDNFWFIPAISIILSYLLVCRIPMFSLKFKNIGWRDNKVRYITAAFGVLSLVLCFLLNCKWSFSLFITFLFYLLFNIISHIYLNINKIWQKAERA
ncbi:MAG: CDP-diacylglycerol--serine O-phosphatidyltransferase [Bacteroidales bacterium]|nr:CDP-diacylglycerol--serine O-phosphatidyltransferase [Bacteroidales bacterium]MDD2425583.1 CDP-diacylglycerol--serine O-phosphatidyltransferase [Bacteroidales bacterium]MDD3988856.1 CDP-diacylglycerol--serine O-phosphatidyltransferase [Bacteroidales bacterium]